MNLNWWNTLLRKSNLSYYYLVKNHFSKCMFYDTLVPVGRKENENGTFENALTGEKKRKNVWNCFDQFKIFMVSEHSLLKILPFCYIVNIEAVKWNIQNWQYFALWWCFSWINSTVFLLIGSDILLWFRLQKIKADVLSGVFLWSYERNNQEQDMWI